MKKLFSFLFFFFLFVSLSQGQEKIEVALEKTTYLVFDSNVEHVDVGSENVSFKIEGTIVKLKAAESGFVDTNMLVYFSGKTTMFLLSYNENPSKLLHEFNGKKGEVNENENETVLSEYEIKKNFLISKRGFKLIDLIDEDPTFIVSDYRQGVSVAVDKIFVDEYSLYFRIHFENESTVAYDIDDVQAMIKSKRKTKSKSLKSMYRNIDLIDSYNLDGRTVRANTTHELVIQIEKITLSEDEELTWVIEEKEGERSFSLKIKPLELVRAIKI
jgi:hypothetical protein